MKINTMRLITFVTLTFLAFSCEEDLLIFSENNYVQLNNTSSVSIIENSGESVTITAVLAGAQPTATTVNFDITGNADPSRYSLTPGSSISIPAGETSGSIVLTPVDNDDIDGDVNITVTLSSSSSVPVGIGGEGLQKISRNITIVDDNVPCNDYVLTILTDAFPAETTWQITDTDGNVVYSGGENYGPNASAASRGKEYVEQVPLEDGCYTFTIFDDYGDGMADGAYNGSWILGCGSIVASSGGGNFGFSSSTDFCVNQ